MPSACKRAVSNLSIAHFVKPIPVLQKLTQLLDKVPAGVGTPQLTILTQHYALFDFNPPLSPIYNPLGHT